MLLMYFTISFIGYSLACLGVGFVFLNLITKHTDQSNSSSAGTQLATAFILGQGILASIWLLLALLGWFSPIVIRSITLICMIGGVCFSCRRFLDFINQMRLILYRLRSETWGWQFLSGITILLCSAWLTSIGRSILGDGSKFYMAIAKLISYTHHLSPLPGFEDLTSFGLQGEMHYAALISLGSPDAAQLFAWPTIIAGSVMLLALGRQIGLGLRGQWIALAMLFSSSAVIWLSGDGKVDLFAVAFGLAALYWAIQIHYGPKKLSLWLTGLFSGFALVAKISYVPVLLPSVALLVVWGYLPELFSWQNWKSTLRSLLLGGLTILIGLIFAFMPHLLKNGVLFQNPILPFGAGSTSWADQTWFGPATTHRILFTYPLALTFGNYWAQYGNLSPLVLAFLPLALLLPRPRALLYSPLLAVELAALVGVITWIIVRPSILSPRYILVVLLIFILLPARAAEFISYNESKPRWLTAGIMCCLGVSIIFEGLYSLGFVFFPERTYAYLSGQIHDCERDAQYCWAMTTINQEAEPGDRVFLASYHHYWLRADLLQCVNTSQETIAELGDTVESRWWTLYQRGFRYLLVDKVSHSFVLDDLNIARPPTWLKLSIIFDHATVTVYRLDFNVPSAPQRITCRQRPSSSIWELVTR